MAIAAVIIGAALYLLVSFAAMGRYVPARRWPSVLSAMLGEAWALALTQPLVPLYYLMGRRMGGARDGRPVIFIHGYFQNRADFIVLARAARRANLGPLYGWNYNWTSDVETCARRLAGFVEAVCSETGKPQVALVAHSLGGVVALEYLATRAGTARVARCVTIGSPHAGVNWRAGMVGKSAKDLHERSPYMMSSSLRPVPVGVLSIFSTHDNIVHPKATSALTARGGEDHEIPGVGHLGLLFSRDAIAAVIRYLAA